MTTHIEKTVFISYRRTNLPWALAIFQNLKNEGYDVFFDYLSIPSGDFENIIVENIRGRAHFVVILTPSALERCSELGDWLRREIETAMDEKRNIVPLMLESFDFGSPSTAKALTGKLEKLKKYNGLRLHSEYFFEGMSRLREQFLNVSLDGVVHPVSESTKPITEDHQIAASEAKQVEQNELTAQEWSERGYVFAVDTKDFDEAIRCFSEAIRLNPADAEALYNRGHSYFDQGNIEKALKDLNEAIRLKPDHLAYTLRGLIWRDEDNLDAAIADYSEAIRQNPNYAEAFFNRGNSRNGKDDLDEALADYNEAIRLNPNYSKAYNNRGNVYLKKGNLDEAIIDYTESIELKNPLLHLPYNNRGWAREGKGDTDGAIADYSEAIRIKPDYIEAYFNRAVAREKKKEYLSAIADYQKYLELGGEEKYGDQKEVEEIIKKLKGKSAKIQPPRKKKAK